ncbi:MAG TPA: hypothetical protein VF980_11370 [Thermoanaerobaculia bacterium]
MRFLRKLIAFALYASVLAPMTDYNLPSWVKAIEVTSTALDRTLRRRKSSLENDHYARFLKLMHALDARQGDVTWRWRSSRRRDIPHKAA